MEINFTFQKFSSFMHYTEGKCRKGWDFRNADFLLESRFRANPRLARLWFHCALEGVSFTTLTLHLHIWFDSCCRFIVMSQTQTWENCCSIQSHTSGIMGYFAWDFTLREMLDKLDQGLSWTSLGLGHFSLRRSVLPWNQYNRQFHS